MRFPLFTKVLLAAVLFVILGVLWSWAAAGVLSIAALLLLGSGGSGEGASKGVPGRRAGPHPSDGGAAAFMAYDADGCDSGGGSDGGGGCDGG